MKVGEALVKEGLITRQQLELALQRQVQFGGRIGTNLLEMRIVGEDELTKFLSRYFRVPFPTASRRNRDRSEWDRQSTHKKYTYIIIADGLQRRFSFTMLFMKKIALYNTTV